MLIVIDGYFHSYMRKHSMRGQKLKSMMIGFFFLVQCQLLAKEATPAFSIKDKAGQTVKSVTEKELATPLFEVHKAKFEKISQLAQEEFLSYFWKQECLRVMKKTTCTDTETQQTMADYLEKNVNVTDKEVMSLLKQHRDNPQLKDLSEKEKTTQIRNFLRASQERTVVAKLLDNAIETKQLVIHTPTPVEPRYPVVLMTTDYLRYGPKLTDTTPAKDGCQGASCPITVVEYSEFQCPFCSRVQETINNLLEKYKGKIVFTSRAFPLGFHNRAKPAAIAAQCAGKEGKFWNMYTRLFENQKNLSDENFQKYAKSLKLNEKKFNTCLKSKEVGALVDTQFKSGQALGVTGTPAFFINGRRMSGAVPLAQFVKVIEEELALEKISKKKDLNKTTG